MYAMPVQAANARSPVVSSAAKASRHLLGLQGMRAAEIRRRLAGAWRLQQRAELDPHGLLDVARGRIVAMADEPVFERGDEGKG